LKEEDYSMRSLILASVVALAIVTPAVAHEHQVKQPVLVSDFSSQEAAQATWEGRPVCVKFGPTAFFCVDRFFSNGFQTTHNHVYVVQVRDTFSIRKEDNEISSEVLFSSLSQMSPSTTVEATLQP